MLNCADFKAAKLYFQLESACSLQHARYLPAFHWDFFCILENKYLSVCNSALHWGSFSCQLRNRCSKWHSSQSPARRHLLSRNWTGRIWGSLKKGAASWRRVKKELLLILYQIQISTYNTGVKSRKIFTRWRALHIIYYYYYYHF